MPEPLIVPGRKVWARRRKFRHTATELLIYDLKFAGQMLRLQGYVSARFATFTEELLSTTLELPLDWYGVASRFVSTTSRLCTFRVVQEPIQVE